MKMVQLWKQVTVETLRPQVEHVDYILFMHTPLSAKCILETVSKH